MATGDKQLREAVKVALDTARALGLKYAACLGAILLFAGVSLLPPQLFQLFTKRLASPDLPTQLLIFGSIVAVVLWLARFGMAFCQEWLRATIENELRGRVLRKLHRTPLANLESAHRGEWYSRVTGDLSRVEFFLTDEVPFQLRTLGVLVGSGALFLVYSGALGLLPLVAAVAVALLNFWLQRKLSPRLRELRELHGGLFHTLVESFDGVRTIRSHGAEKFLEGQFTDRLKVVRNKSLTVVRLIGALLGSNELFSQLLIVLCLIGATVAVANGTLTSAEALFYPFYLGMFFEAAQDIAKSAYDWNRFVVEGSRLAEFLHGPELAPARVSAAAAVPSRVVLEGVSFGHTPARPLATKMRFELKRGELWVLTGPSGCGKSTLFEMLAGLRPGLGGTVADIPVARDFAQLRSLFGYVEQRPYLFAGTLRENLTLGGGQYDANALWTALDRAALREFALQAGGLDFPIRDQGRNLSEGQKYRLALARALLLDRPFLLIDEPFAALDPASITTVVRALNAHKIYRGIWIISHQIPEDLDADGIVEFEELSQNLDGFPLVRAGIGAASTDAALNQ